LDIKKEVEEIPGLKEVKQIKETANKIKNIAKILKQPPSLLICPVNPASMAQLKRRHFI